MAVLRGMPTIQYLAQRAFLVRSVHPRGMTLYWLQRKKLALYGTDGWLLTTDICANFKVKWHKNKAEYQKSGAIKFRYVNGRGDSFWKRPDFQLWRARDLDLGSGHTAYRRASLFNCYLHAKLHGNQRNFGRTDGRAYVHMHRHLKPAILGRLCRRVNLKMVTRHPVEGSFGSEFPAICNNLRVTAAGSLKTPKCTVKWIQYLADAERL